MTLPHRAPVPSGHHPWPGVSAAHFLAVTFYGLVIWLSVLAWAAIAVPPGAVLLALALAPVVVSVVMGLLVLAAWLRWLRWLWLGRATLRLWRSRLASHPGRMPRADPS